MIQSSYVRCGLLSVLVVSTFLIIALQFNQVSNRFCKYLQLKPAAPSSSPKGDMNSFSSSFTNTTMLRKELMNLYDGVETFVLFVGYARSGHSIVGAILDAHPDIIIAHEYGVVGKWRLFRQSKLLKYRLFYDLHSRSQEQALFLSRSNPGRFVQTAWQGTYKNRLKVIGDKMGFELSSAPFSNLQVFFQEFNERLKMPLKMIHVVRNPFDNIATMALRRRDMRDTVRDGSTKLNDPKTLDYCVAKYFAHVLASQRIIEEKGNMVLTLTNDEFINQPRKTLQTLCDHLMVTCYQDYVDACVKIIYNKPTATRSLVVWTDAQKETVLKEIEKYPFLRKYNFEDTSV